jgi:Peptidase family S41
MPAPAVRATGVAGWGRSAGDSPTAALFSRARPGTQAKRPGRSRKPVQRRRDPQELTQEVPGRPALLPARPPHRHQDRLRPRTGPGPAAAPDLAQDDAEADGQLRTPVGRVQARLTGGRVAYVYLPDTAGQGYTRFNRYCFAQAGRDGVIVDERFNGGGLLADHVIDYLREPVRNYATTRQGADQQFPTSAIPGPKVMLINEQAGSGGDYLPSAFRQAGLGPLVGKRTWSGLVGIGGYPPLVDGGGVTAPRWGIWFPSGKWEVENRGVAPDVEVEFDPKAVEIVLDELKRYPVKHPSSPRFPNYYRPGVKDPAEGK